MWCIIVLSIVYSVGAEQDISGYRKSMMLSDENPGRPAIFTHTESPVQQNVHGLDDNTGKIHTGLEYQRQQLIQERQEFHLEQLKAAKFRARRQAQDRLQPDDGAGAAAKAAPSHSATHAPHKARKTPDDGKGSTGDTL